MLELKLFLGASREGMPCRGWMDEVRLEALSYLGFLCFVNVDTDESIDMQEHLDTGFLFQAPTA
jgi:hypothetical protein